MIYPPSQTPTLFIHFFPKLYGKEKRRIGTTKGKAMEPGQAAQKLVIHFLWLGFDRGVFKFDCDRFHSCWIS
jgi:hypothetical protein